MKKRKSSVNGILAALLVISLSANVVLAVFLGMTLTRKDSQESRQIQESSSFSKDQEESVLSHEEEETSQSGTEGSSLNEKGESKENGTDTGTQDESGKDAGSGKKAESESLSGDESTEDGSEAGSGSQGDGESEKETQKQAGGVGSSQVSQQGPIPDILENQISAREVLGETWAVSVQILEDSEHDSQIYEYHGDVSMQSASVIKVFIMGAVYDRMCYPSSPDRLISMNESYDGELRDLLEQMITVSDNNAANRLVELLGEGDFQKGAQVVNQFCEEYGFESTRLGRRFLEENPSDDNYTSAADCTRILAMIYEGECVGQEASEKMLDILNRQTNTVKIPSGLPQGTRTANKTGEMPEGYGLGCIENDMAVVYSGDGGYILTVLSNNLGGRNSEAQQVIRDISSQVWSWYEKE